MAEKTLEQMREAVEEIRAKMAAAAREAGRDGGRQCRAAH